MMNTRFSVVTPNLNMGSFLSRTIESVLVNLQPGDEYFVVDGNSTDDSKEIIKSYEHKLSGWVSENDSGYADALAKGFRRCTGEYLCWVNSGDLLLDGALDVVREELSKGGLDLLMGDDVCIDEDDNVLRQSRGGVVGLKYMMLFGPWTPLQDACFWTRLLYESVGGINPDLKYAADYDFFLRAVWSGRSAYSPTVYSAFRRHRGQKSIAGSTRYKQEQGRTQVQMSSVLQISPLQKALIRPACWFFVRVRHHLLQRFFPTWISTKGKVSGVRATRRARRNRSVF